MNGNYAEVLYWSYIFQSSTTVWQYQAPVIFEPGYFTPTTISFKNDAYLYAARIAGNLYDLHRNGSEAIF